MVRTPFMSTSPSTPTLTVLGASPAFTNPGGACSGYLLRQGNEAVQVDLGPGVLGRLRQHVAPHQLSAIVISHLHADHYFDLVPLYYGLRYGSQPQTANRRLPLLLPPGGTALLRRLSQVVGQRASMLEKAFAIQEYAPGPSHAAGPFGITFHPVQHYIPSHAMRVSVGPPKDDGCLLAFSSDSAPCDALVQAARGARVFLCEAAIMDPSEDETSAKARGHLSAAEAGQIARAAGVQRLLITHYRRDAESLDAHHLAAATSTFGAGVELAVEGRTYSLT